MWREHHTAKEIEREIGDWEADAANERDKKRESSAQPPGLSVGDDDVFACASARRSACRRMTSTRDTYGLRVRRLTRFLPDCRRPRLTYPDAKANQRRPADTSLHRSQHQVLSSMGIAQFSLQKCEPILLRAAWDRMISIL